MPGRRRKRHDHSKLSLPRQHQILAQRIISGISQKRARSCAGSRRICRSARSRGIVHALVRIGGIVAAILNEVGRQHADAHRLQELRYQQHGNHDVAHGSLAGKRTGTDPVSPFVNFLRELHGCFLAARRESAHIQRVVVKQRISEGLPLLAEKAGLDVGERRPLFNRGIRRLAGSLCAPAQGNSAGSRSANPRD